MEEFIQQITGSLGIDDKVARGATGSVLGFLKDKVDPGDFSSLLGKLPGASDLMQGAESTASGGGLMGGLMSQAASAMGGKLGSAAGLAGLLGKSGLDLSQAASFVTSFLGFARKKAGPELVEKILGQVPDLKELIG